MLCERRILLLGRTGPPQQQLAAPVRLGFGREPGVDMDDRAVGKAGLEREPCNGSAEGDGTGEVDLTLRAAMRRSSLPLKGKGTRLQKRQRLPTEGSRFLFRI